EPGIDAGVGRLAGVVEQPELSQVLHTFPPDFMARIALAGWGATPVSGRRRRRNSAVRFWSRVAFYPIRRDDARPTIQWRVSEAASSWRVLMHSLQRIFAGRTRIVNEEGDPCCAVLQDVFSNGAPSRPRRRSAPSSSF